jgi:hypothetical protein
MQIPFQAGIDTLPRFREPDEGPVASPELMRTTRSCSPPGRNIVYYALVVPNIASRRGDPTRSFRSTLNTARCLA